MDWSYGQDHPGHWVSQSALPITYALLTSFSTNCRLPQTPRTPSSAAAHYFDDTFSRQRRASLGQNGRKSPRLARSLTRTRSIGARSDWSGTHGDTEPDLAGEEADEAFTNGKPDRTWSIYQEDANGNGKKPEEDPDDPINKYVQDQLQRIKSNESHDHAEELASLNDGANDLKDEL